MKTLLLAETLLTITALTSPAFASGPNLLENPSFELPAGGYVDLPGGSTIPGWITILDGAEIFTHTQLGPPSVYPLTTIPDGTQAIDLPPVLRTGGGGIEQTFPTIPGEAYDVSFFLGTSTFNFRTATGNVRVIVDGQQHSYDLSTTSSDWDWKPFGFQFIADGTSATLTFESFDEPSTHFASVDAVSVIAAPDGGKTALLLALSVGGFTLGRSLLRRELSPIQVLLS
jgi:hypothetical protein